MFTATSVLQRSRRAVLGMVYLYSPHWNNSYTFKHVRDSTGTLCYCYAEATSFPEMVVSQKIPSSNSG